MKNKKLDVVTFCKKLDTVKKGAGERLLVVYQRYFFTLSLSSRQEGKRVYDIALNISVQSGIKKDSAKHIGTLLSSEKSRSYSINDFAMRHLFIETTLPHLEQSKSNNIQHRASPLFRVPKKISYEAKFTK